MLPVKYDAKATQREINKAEQEVTRLSDQVSNLQTTVNGIPTNVSQFAADIATNTGNIATNTGSITTLSGTVATHGAAVTTVNNNSANWNTAYGWGDHSQAGYLTAETSHTDVVVDGDFTSEGLMKRGSTDGSYSIVTDSSANWDTAYGWGNHGSAGYLTSHQDISGKASLTGAIFSGTVFIGTSNVNSGSANFLVGHSHSTTNDRNIVSGYDNTVSGSNNNVSGQGNTVNSDVSLVTGYDNVTGSTAHRGITAGYNNFNYGENSIIVGNSNSTGSTGHSSIVGGFNNTANGSHCFSVGYQCQVGQATKWFSTALGYQSRSYGNASFAGGRSTYDGSTKYTQVDADAGFAFGTGNYVYTNAPSSVALGTLTQCGESNPASGVTAAQSMAIGYKSKAYKDNSFAGGNQSYSFGDTSFSFGNGAVASNGFSNIALGRGITTPVSGGTATTIGAVSVGQFNEYAVTTDQHFSVGTGTADSSRYTSMYVGPRSSADSGIVMQSLKDTPSYSTDNAAGLAGVPIGGIYRYFSYVRIRMA